MRIVGSIPSKLNSERLPRKNVVMADKRNDTCNLCDANKFEILRHSLRGGETSFKVYTCVNCSHVQLLPKPTLEEDKEFYDKNMQDKMSNKQIDYEMIRKNFSFDTNRYVTFVKAMGFTKENSILDVGVGYGYFVRSLAEQGYTEVTGIEISDERRAIAQRQTVVPILNYNIWDPQISIDRFDLVTLFGVLEHISDPIGFLRRIKEQACKTSTLLLCEVPNVHELMRDECAAYNDFYWIRAHVNYFSEETLRDCFHRAGFCSVEVQFEQRYGIVNLCHWLTTGSPQINRPIFEIEKPYKPIDEFYRNFLISQKRTDSLLVLARM